MKTIIEHGHGKLVTIPAGDVALEGNLIVPPKASGVVLFAHGSGSSRFSSRNRAVAAYLNEGGLGTLLMDLLSESEEAIDLQTTQLRFDIAFLAERLLYAKAWLKETAETKDLKTGLFGSSTGGGAALAAAAQEPAEISAVVSRGGRPDLAGPALPDVKCPTLLIVGGRDFPVIELNKEAYEQLTCTKAMEIVPGATHLFEERGALEEVSRLTRDWFRKYLQ
ncbi:MAG: alpha/beta hydrolase [Verrucomicrobia bacterium]|nr:alpha/beta hydrolase [Verrucomicrobiota bacterium]